MDRRKEEGVGTNVVMWYLEGSLDSAKVCRMWHYLGICMTH